MVLPVGLDRDAGTVGGSPGVGKLDGQIFVGIDRNPLIRVGELAGDEHPVLDLAC